MSNYEYLDTDDLRALYHTHQKNLAFLLHQKGSYTESALPLNLLNSIDAEQKSLDAIGQELQSRGINVPIPRTEHAPAQVSLPASASPLPSPPTHSTQLPAQVAVVARPPLFTASGPLPLEQALHARQRDLDTLIQLITEGQSINLMAPKGSGKTTLLARVQAQPPDGFVCARLDMRDNVTDVDHFYGTALRELLAGTTHPELQSRYAALCNTPVCTYDQFRNALQLLRTLAQPVLLIDHFDAIADEDRKTNFSPIFFKNLRSLSDSSLLQLVIASRQTVVDICTNLALTSPLTTDAQTHRLYPFTAKDAQEFLMRHGKLSTTEAHAAWEWSEGHPTALNVAAKSILATRQDGLRAAKARFDELAPPPQRRRTASQASHMLRMLLIEIPARISKTITMLGQKISDWVAAAIFWGVVLIGVLVVFRVLPLSVLLDALKGLGVGGD